MIRKSGLAGSMSDLPENSVLDPVHDEMLIRNLDAYAEAAGLAGNPRFIWESVKDKSYLRKSDLEFFSKIFSLEHDEGGLACGVMYEGFQDVSLKFMAGTGLLVRNYINAAYMPMQEVFGLLLDNQFPTARVLFIPDLFMYETESKQKNHAKYNRSGGHGGASEDKTSFKAYAWKKELLSYLFTKRQAEGWPTVISVSNLGLMQKAYGHEITRFIKDHFVEHKNR